jgi:hypothetical protein
MRWARVVRGADEWRLLEPAGALVDWRYRPQTLTDIVSMCPDVTRERVTMDAVQLTINGMTILVSLAALLVSGVIAYRQTRIMRQANNVSLAIQMIDTEFRSGAYYEHEAFLLNRLRSEHPPCAYSELPVAARASFGHVAYLYQWLGQMIVFDLLEEEFILASFTYRIRQMWPILEPYIRLEREVRGDSFLSFFEDLAARAARRGQYEIQQRLGLKKMPTTFEV